MSVSENGSIAATRLRRSRPELPSPWRCEPEWLGETVFIIAGGPSVLTQNLELLRGRRIIVINSSVHAVSWADMLFFGDWRWFEQDQDNKRAVQAFEGIAICANTNTPWHHPIVRKMRRKPPARLSQDPSAVSYKWTSITAAINLAVHRGAGAIVLLGADGRASNGRTHHHAPHKWPVKLGCWDKHKAELAVIAPQLTIPVINASPGSAWSMWPVMTLPEALKCVPQ
jgi:hypothetical protein